MKALFITHDTSNYGASRSLQLLLGNCNNMAVDLLVQRKFRGKHDHDELRGRFGAHIQNVFEAYLPFDDCYKGGRTKLHSRIALKLYNILQCFLEQRRVNGLIARGDYDFIYLNSLVLNPLIDERSRFILHVREVYNRNNQATLTQVCKAAGVIFIDDATRAPFSNAPLQHNVILNNPFDMSGLSAYEGFRPDQCDVDPSRHTVFSVIGVISEQKGTGFIIQTFMRLQDPTARLLIVGGRLTSALAECRRLAASDPRIVFWGEEQEIMKVYAISDYILRGEDFPCVGRTIYEGLYAGCRVIVPGDAGAPPPMFEMEAFSKMIHFYTPRDGDALLDLFTRLTPSKISGRQLKSNVGDYLEKFTQFASEVCSDRPSEPGSN